MDDDDDVLNDIYICIFLTVERLEDESDIEPLPVTSRRMHDSDMKDICDTEISMPSIVESIFTASGREKKSSRVWNRDSYCCYCSFSGININQHLKTHTEKKEVRDILDDKINRSKRMSLLRIKGNHQHNLDVLQKKQGELVVARRQQNHEFSSEEYGPCSECLQWMKISDIHRHQASTRCLALQLKSKPISHGSSIRMQAKLLKSPPNQSYEEASPLLKEEVLDKMRAGETRNIAMGDRIVVKLGEEWLSKSCGNDRKRGNYSSEHMRRVANLLIETRKIDSEKCLYTMEEFLEPGSVDLIIQASKSMAGFESQFKMASPSIVRKLREDLLRMAQIKKTFAIKEHNTVLKIEAEEFMVVLQQEWETKIARSATVEEKKRNFEKEVHLPEPSDIETLSLFLRNKLNNLEDYESLDDHHHFVKYLQTRLVTYNKRRPGEIEELK